MSMIGHQIDHLLKYMRAQREFFHRRSEQRPPGTLVTRKYKGNELFVQAVPVEGKKRKYCRKTIYDENLLGAFASADYADAAIQIIDNNERILEDAQAGLIELTPEEIRKRMPDNAAKVPEGLLLADPIRGQGSEKRWQTMHEWAAQHYQKSQFRPEDRNKSTSRGLHVRSKSVLMLCEKFYEYGIPFRYEQEIIVGRYRLAPPFTLLDSEGQEFYVEYFSGMDDLEGVERFLWKRRKYESAGICEWDNLICIFEKGNTINLEQIDDIIRTQIIPRIESTR